MNDEEGVRHGCTGWRGRLGRRLRASRRQRLRPLFEYLSEWGGVHPTNVRRGGELTVGHRRWQQASGCLAVDVSVGGMDVVVERVAVDGRLWERENASGGWMHRSRSRREGLCVGEAGYI